MRLSRLRARSSTSDCVGPDTVSVVLGCPWLEWAGSTIVDLLSICAGTGSTPTGAAAGSGTKALVASQPNALFSYSSSLSIVSLARLSLGGGLLGCHQPHLSTPLVVEQVLVNGQSRLFVHAALAECCRA